MGAQLFAEQAHEFSTMGSRHIAPGEEGRVGGVNRPACLGRGGLVYMGDDLSSDRGGYREGAIRKGVAGRPKTAKQSLYLRCQRGYGWDDHGRLKRGC